MTSGVRLFGDDGAPLGPQERPLTPEQAVAVTRREGAMLLSANAGSGKTTVLAERFVRAVLEDGLEPSSLLAITFTDKAAGELRTRLRARLMELGARDAAREMDAAWVSTIHGFCARVLRAHAVAAGLDPQFTVLDESTGRGLRDRAWDAALERFLADGEDGAPRTTALELVAAYGPDPLRDAIEAVHGELRSHGHERPELPPARPRGTPAAALARLRAAHAAVDAELAAVTRSIKSLDAARETLTEARALLAVPDAEADVARLAGLKLGRACAELKTEACDAFREAVAGLVEAVVDARALQDWALLDELLQEYAARYAEAKRAVSALDYDDLELGLHRLFSADAALAAAYAERFARVMVDEFQDTNPLQLRILERLRAETIFAVGDELQSIYGFRHADVAAFRRLRAEHEARGEAATLRTNWRSRPELLSTINAWLGPLHDHYVPLAAGRTDAPDPDGPRTELLLVDAAWDGDGVDELLADRVRAGMPSGRLSRQAEARAIARRVRQILDADARRPGDVAVLLRAATDLQLFERALELEGLPTLASGGRGFWGRQQVQDLTSYLAVLANPRDELALYATLASPLCGLTADALALLARDTPTDELPPADRARLAAFRERLAAERVRAPRFRLDELIARVVRDTAYDLHVLRLPGGRRRLANVHKLERLAAEFEAAHGRDLRGFIDHARAELDADAREPEAPIDPGDRSAVALMTIHAAKGLEFPVVVVADLGRNRVARTPRILFDGDRAGLRVVRAGEDNLEALEFAALKQAAHAREAEEERRILHVAVTRAEERLVLSATTPLGPDAEWPTVSTTSPAIAEIGPLLGAALPQELAERSGLDLDEVRGDDVLRLRVQRVAPQDAGEMLGIDVSAGQTALVLDGGAPRLVAEAARHADAAAVTPPAPAPVAPPATLSYSQLAGYERCGYRHYLERVLRLPTVTDDLALPDALEIAGMDPLVRGSIVHELLEELPLDAAAEPDDAELDRRAARHGIELDDDARADLRALVRAFLDSRWFAWLRDARHVQREAVFAYPLGDSMLGGVVDARAVDDAGRALVIDYKTDRLAPDVDLEHHVERDYGVQRRIYALAELRAGATAVEVVHLFLERPDEPAVARFTAADAPRIEAELLARAGGLLRGEYPVAAEPHVLLCRGCPGRGTLCSQPKALTERPVPGAPTPSATPAAG